MTWTSSPLHCFAHLSAPHAALYREILDVFARARAEFLLNLRASEVADRLQGGLSEDEVVAALSQLCQWGNLDAFNDNSQALSLQEFYRRHLYYQLTGPGVAALRAIELFHELVDTPASLQATALAAVRDRLAELIQMAKAQEAGAPGSTPSAGFDVAKASSLVEGLFDELENLTDQAQEFFRGLQATVELREVSVDAFLNFKDRLVHYLERFLNQVVTVAGEAEMLIESVDEMAIDAMLHSIAMHRTADELDVTVERVERVRAQLRSRWSGVVGWFIAPVGKTSQADELRSLARTGIREVAAAATRLNRERGGMIDRGADFRTLAVWFAQCSDARAAHRLWRTAFALSPARHLTVSDETLVQRDQSPISSSTSWAESPPLRIAPTLRKSGRVARSARTPRLVDNREELESLRIQSFQEAEQLRRAREELLTPRRRISEFPPISANAFPLLLDLLGEALTRAGEATGAMEAASTDGSMFIRMEPTDDGARCRLITDWGELRGRDYWVSIHDVAEPETTRSIVG
jgi:uncharacterized protein (TIGR02677 family)